MTVRNYSANESVNKSEHQADFWIFRWFLRPVFLDVLPKNHFTPFTFDHLDDSTMRTLFTLIEIPKSAQVRIDLYHQYNSKHIGSQIQDINSDSVWVTNQFDQVNTWNL